MPRDFGLNKIEDILPQKPPFLFIDKVLEFSKEDKTITCAKNITAGEEFLTGHFPAKPVMPGVLIIESMAQASIMLYAGLKPETAKKKPIYYLGKVEAKFLNPVTPGDVILLKIKGEKIINNAGIVTAEAFVKDTVVVKAKIAFGVKVTK